MFFKKKLKLYNIFMCKNKLFILLKNSKKIIATLNKKKNKTQKKWL